MMRYLTVAVLRVMAPFLVFWAILVGLSLLSLVMSNCSSPDSDLSYGTGFTGEQRSLVKEAMEIWAVALEGITWDAGDGGTFIFREGNSKTILDRTRLDNSTGAITFNRVRLKRDVKADNPLDFDRVLEHANIHINPALWAVPSIPDCHDCDVVLWVLLHEIGHGLNLRHSNDCDSLMWSPKVSDEECEIGTTDIWVPTVDQTSRELALGNIRNGWIENL